MTIVLVVACMFGYHYRSTPPPLPFPRTLVSPTRLITLTQPHTHTEQVGFGGSKWQRRFLVLQGTSLSVYATPESAGPLRTIPLAGLVVRTEVCVCPYACACVCLMCMWVHLMRCVATHTSNPSLLSTLSHTPTTHVHSSLLP